MATTDVEFNPFLPEILADPYPYYRRMREVDPIHWNDSLRVWFLTRHEDCVDLLRHDDRFSADRRRSERFQPPPPGREEPGRSMLVSDPPDHTRLRGLVTRAFTPRMIERLRGRIESITDELLEHAAGRAQVDLVVDIAYPLPVVVIAEMLGVPARDRESFQEWSATLVRGLDPILDPDTQRVVLDARDALRDYLRGVIADHRARPRDDLMSALIAVEERGDTLSEDDLLIMCQLLLVAGHETTVNLLGAGTLALLQHPDQLERLRDDPGLARTAVEELLRFTSSVQWTGRIPFQDVELGGRTLRATQAVVAILGAANRDPAVFDRPDELDLGRDPNPHISFSRGIHFCLGAPLARLEAQIALPMLLRRFPGLRLAGEPVRRPTLVLRGFSHLPVALGT